MKGKKAISDVIVSVLMILLVIAAIAILWTVLSRFINTGTENIQPQTDCLSVKMEILNAKNTSTSTNMTVQYVSGPKKLDKVMVYASNGSSVSAGAMNIGESKFVTFIGNYNGKDVYAVGQFGTTNPTVCGSQASTKVTVVSA